MPGKPGASVVLRRFVGISRLAKAKRDRFGDLYDHCILRWAQNRASAHGKEIPGETRPISPRGAIGRPLIAALAIRLDDVTVDELISEADDIFRWHWSSSHNTAQRNRENGYGIPTVAKYWEKYLKFSRMKSTRQPVANQGIVTHDHEQHTQKLEPRKSTPEEIENARQQQIRNERIIAERLADPDYDHSIPADFI